MLSRLSRLRLLSVLLTLVLAATRLEKGGIDKKKRTWSILAVALLALALALAPVPVQGFGTVNNFGGQNNEHERITRAALACAATTHPPICFDPESLRQLAGHDAYAIKNPFNPHNCKDDPLNCFVDEGAVGVPDKAEGWTNPTPNPGAHCDNGDFLRPKYMPNNAHYLRKREQATDDLLKCLDVLHQRFRWGIEAAKAILDSKGQIDPAQVNLATPCTFMLVPGADRRAKCQAIEGFGRALHGAQDFYSHSNWADVADSNKPIGLNNPPGLDLDGPSYILAGLGLPLDKWQTHRDNLIVPPDLATGCDNSDPTKNTFNCGNFQPTVPFSGTWRTVNPPTWMVLVQRGNHVTGTYVHKQGKIDGTVTTRTTGTGKDAITTFTLTGRWSQAPTYQAPHDAGDFQFVLSKQGWRPYFAGKRRYGSAGAYTDGWDGTRRARLTHDSTGPGDDGLNKDEGIIDPRTGAATKPETPRGQIKDTSGNTNFEKAVAGAIAETRRQWRDFGQALVARYGLPQAQRMICALVRDNPLKDCDPATCSLDPYTPKGVPVSAAGRGAVMTRYRPTDAGPAAPAAAVCTAPAPDWNGTYSDGPHVYTLRASGSSVTGEGKWTLPGHTFAESGSTENFGSCTANGNTTTCPDATGEYHDADKSITYTAQVTLTLSDDGNTLTTSRTLTSTTVTWKPGVAPYESAVHVGATFTDTDTRIGSQ